LRTGARATCAASSAGDTAVAFTLTEPLAIFPTFLAMPVASVAPSPVPADFGQRPVGTGAVAVRRVEHDDYLRFVRNPSYWSGASLSESLTVRIIPEALTRRPSFWRPDLCRRGPVRRDEEMGAGASRLAEA